MGLRRDLNDEVTELWGTGTLKPQILAPSPLCSWLGFLSEDQHYGGHHRAVVPIESRQGEHMPLHAQMGCSDWPKNLETLEGRTLGPKWK